MVNVLVEESSLFSGTGGAVGANRIRSEFREAMEACARAANTDQPTMAEPVINITDNGSQTCDPCSLVGPWDLVAMSEVVIPPSAAWYAAAAW